MKNDKPVFIRKEKQRNGMTLYVFKVGAVTIKTPNKGYADEKR